MIPVDDAWDNFNKQGYPNIPQDKKEKKSAFSPKCSDIYISTKTKIAYLNSPIDLMKIFWTIPVLLYQERREGVIKKQMKVNCLNEGEINFLETQIEEVKRANVCIEVDILKKVKNTGKIKFKDTRKINIGLSKKDLCTFRKKKKGAFYNCFVLMMRIWDVNSFKEIHVKVFNTGKLEIPGVRDDLILTKTLNLLIKTLQPFHCKKIYYKEDSIETVLINSNFTCNYYINRDKLFNILKYKYNINVIFDACSYPGIQCKFYYNTDNSKNDGVCYCSNKCNKKGGGSGDGQCKEISFMIFRTGSVLIVGNCTDFILNIIYTFLKVMLKNEYLEIYIENSPPVIEKKKNKRIRKKKIFIGRTAD